MANGEQKWLSLAVAGLFLVAIWQFWAGIRTVPINWLAELFWGLTAVGSIGYVATKHMR